MSESKARKEIVMWGRELYEQGMVSGSGGNLSIRLSDDRVLFTPTGLFLGHLSEETISLTDGKGNLLDGLKPTKEVPLHLAVYETRPNVHAVVHTHSIYAIAFASTHSPGAFLPVYTPSIAAKVGPVLITDYQGPGSEKLAENVRDGIQNSNAVLLSNHGVVAVGKDMKDAVAYASEVESNARLYFETNGKTRILDEKDVIELNRKVKL